MPSLQFEKIKNEYTINNYNKIKDNNETLISIENITNNELDENNKDKKK